MLGITMCDNNGVEGHENPVRAIRNYNGLSLRKAAKRIGCNYQAIYMTEHGMYFRVPPIILDWAGGVGDKTEDQIEKAYDAYRDGRIKATSEKFSMHMLRVDDLGIPDENPVLSLRKFLQLTTSGFCKEFCVPVSMLYEAENHAKSLPSKLADIFEQMGVSPVVIQEMEDRYV